MVGRPFEKGKSGNISGRPKADPSVIARLRELTPMAVEKLATIAMDDKHKQQFAAVESILNRVLGMPKQPIGLEDDTDSGNIASGLSQFVTLLARAGGSGQTGGVVTGPVVGDAQTEPDAT